MNMGSMAVQHVDQPVLREVVRIFRSLSDESRVRIVNLLIENTRLCVSDIASSLDIPISSVSHHLRLLKDLGFVGHERDGKKVYHSLIDDCIRDILRRAIEHVGEE